MQPVQANFSRPFSTTWSHKSALINQAKLKSKWHFLLLSRRLRNITKYQQLQALGMLDVVEQSNLI